MSRTKRRMWAVAVALALGTVTMAVAGPKSSPAPRPSAPAGRDSTAAARPVYTGRWTLHLDRSVLGNLPGIPKARTDSIAHRADQIVQILYLVLPTGPDTTVYRYRLGNGSNVNRVDGRDITSTVTWEGNALHLLSKTKLLMMDMSLDERWRLSPRRDSLIMTRTVKYPMGEGAQRLVFVRE